MTDGRSPTICGPGSGRCARSSRSSPAHPDLAYLDSAATAQKPQAVLDAVQHYLTTCNANAGRGTYPWANRTTALVERGPRAGQGRSSATREPERSARALHQRHDRGAADRRAATGCAPYLRDGDEIVVPFADHQANIAAVAGGRRACWRGRACGSRVMPMPYQAAPRDYDHRALADAGRPADPVRRRHPRAPRLRRRHERAPASGRPWAPTRSICLDAAQSVGSSAGVRGRRWTSTSWSSPGTRRWPCPAPARCGRGRHAVPRFAPGRLERHARTPRASSSLAAALDWLDAAGLDRIERWTVGLATRLTDGLRRLDAYEILGCRASLAAGSAVQRRHGIVTFRHRGIASDDLGFILFEPRFHGALPTATARATRARRPVRSGSACTSTTPPRRSTGCWPCSPGSVTSPAGRQRWVRKA